MDVFIIVILTMAIYSIIGTIAYLISKENETVAIAFGLGIAGLTVVGLAKLIHAIRNHFKYHIGKKSILEDVKTKSDTGARRNTPRISVSRAAIS